MVSQVDQTENNERDCVIRFYVIKLTYLRSYFEDGQRFQEAAITNGRRSLYDTRSLRTDLAIEARPFVKIRPGEIDLAKISRIVHVIK